MRITAKYLLIAANVVAALLLAASYVSAYIPPDRWWFPAFLCLSYPVFLAINFVFIVFWMIVKPRFMVLSLVVVLSGAGFFNRYVRFRGKTAEGDGIKVLSFNVNHFQGDKKYSPAAAASKIIDFIDEQDADIVCFQEVRLNRNDIFNLRETVNRLENVNHYQYARSSSTYGSVTMTRYPIISMGEIRFDDTRNITIFTDIVIDDDTVRVFNVHLQSYLIDPSSYSVIDSLDLSEGKGIRELREIGGKIKTASAMRAEQVRKIRENIDSSPYKVVVCGDFNDTPVSYSYQKIRGDLKDAFVESGRGVGRTYVGKLPSFRIDYILHSREFDSFNFKTIGFRISDHLPISCVLINKEN